MTDALYKKFVKRWEEVMDLPPQTLGSFTPFYKFVTRYLKVMPWPLLVALSTGLVVSMYYLLGSTITIVASLLQRGF